MDSEYFWVSGEVIAYPFEFTSRKVVKEFISSFSTCSNSMSEFIMFEACDPSDTIFMKPSTNRKNVLLCVSSSSRSSTYFFLFFLSSVGC